VLTTVWRPKLRIDQVKKVLREVPATATVRAKSKQTNLSERPRALAPSQQPQPRARSPACADAVGLSRMGKCPMAWGGSTAAQSSPRAARKATCAAWAHAAPSCRCSCAAQVPRRIQSRLRQSRRRLRLRSRCQRRSCVRQHVRMVRRMCSLSALIGAWCAAYIACAWSCLARGVVCACGVASGAVFLGFVRCPQHCGSAIRRE
jgi:hypothetical protein